MIEAKPLRVLIADDEPLAAERLQLLLAKADGAQLVGTASDGDSPRSILPRRCRPTCCCSTSPCPASTGSVSRGR